eukprot:Cvel_29048.t1-p1 / transcript=Cvel_29048.t1 / gene=Cvel_29048 / organism=Chromera_velia_CCMP2878 / gene_product=Oleosin GRP-17, putative / transcript_product=Oleosin GRP-17, putative / location=Cvel_scaffold3916:1-2059(-) / protein_length=423 / sequence_SO=supercontig / SO=protein_coding / is_pseudo=false
MSKTSRKAGKEGMNGQSRDMSKSSREAGKGGMNGQSRNMSKSSHKAGKGGMNGQSRDMSKSSREAGKGGMNGQSRDMSKSSREAGKGGMNGQSRDMSKSSREAGKGGMNGQSRDMSKSSREAGKGGMNGQSRDMSKSSREAGKGGMNGQSRDMSKSSREAGKGGMNGQSRDMSKSSREAGKGGMHGETGKGYKLQWVKKHPKKAFGSLYAVYSQSECESDCVSSVHVRKDTVLKWVKKEKKNFDGSVSSSDRNSPDLPPPDPLGSQEQPQPSASPPFSSLTRTNVSPASCDLSSREVEDLCEIPHEEVSVVPGSEGDEEEIFSLPPSDGEEGKKRDPFEVSDEYTWDFLQVLHAEVGHIGGAALHCLVSPYLRSPRLRQLCQKLRSECSTCLQIHGLPRRLRGKKGKHIRARAPLQHMAVDTV